VIRVAALAAVAACVGPQVADDPAPSGDIVPAGTPIPSIDSDPDAATIAANDGVDGVVPRLTAFAAGAQVHYWDFGPAPAIAAPMFRLVRRMDDGSLVPTDHPPILGTIPGEAGYSPYWSVFDLVVTDLYFGQLITSSTAVEEAARDGLVEPPVAQPIGAHLAVVASDVTIDVGSGAPLPPNAIAFYEHKTVACFDFGPVPLTQQVRVAAAARYVLHRSGEEPLSEPLRHVDIDGDGDVADSNDVFERAPDDPMRSPLSRTIDVAVVSTTASIDTSRNDAIADVKAADQLFTPQPTVTVVGYDMTDDLRNCPLQRAAGGL
jgi:hypothetical protein